MKGKTLGEILKSLFKPATTKYPFEPSPVPEKFRGKPEFNEEKCVGCGSCVQLCPSGALTLEDKDGIRTITLFYGKCTFCARCEEICPEDGIHMTEQYELATYTTEEEKITIKFELQKCNICGTPFIPKVQIERGFARIKDLLEKHGIKESELRSIIEICPNCRKTVETIPKARKILVRMMAK